MAFTLNSVGQRHTLYRDAQTGLYRSEITIHDQRYDTGSGLAAVVEALETDGTEGFALRANRLRHAVRLANDGTRRWYPRRNVPTEYVEFGRPEYWTGAAWQALPLGVPTRPDSQTLLWDRTNFALQLGISWRRLKMDLTLKSAAAARRVRWPVSLVGLGWSDWSLLGQDGTTVGRIERPTAEDANGVDVPLTVQYEGGYVSVLADLTGVTYPVVIDPTFTAQPDATAGLDTWIQSNAPTTNFSTDTRLYIGETTRVHRSLIEFDLSSIPAGATLTSSTLSLYLTADFAANARTYRVYRLKRAWVESQVTWNNYSTGNAWSTAGAFGVDDCEQTDIGSRAMSATETANQFKDWSLTPTTVAALDLGNGWLIMADTEVDDAYEFSSSDNATAANRPKLVIEYTAGNPYYAYAQQ